MIHNTFKGLGIALVTPFTKEGLVDFTALRRLLDYQLSNGIDFICLLGTTAETPTLSAEERQQVKDLVVEKVNGQVPILMGCGGNLHKRDSISTLKLLPPLLQHAISPWCFTMYQVVWVLT